MSETKQKQSELCLLRLQVQRLEHELFVERELRQKWEVETKRYHALWSELYRKGVKP